MVLPFAPGLLAFGAGTYGFVSNLLKFLLVGKLLFCFLYGGGLNPGLQLSKKFLDLSLFLLRFYCLRYPCSYQSLALCKVVTNVLGMSNSILSRKLGGRHPKKCCIFTFSSLMYGA